MSPRKRKAGDGASSHKRPPLPPAATRRNTRNAGRQLEATTVVERKDEILVSQQEISGSARLRRKEGEAGTQRKRIDLSLVHNLLAIADTHGVQEAAHVDADQLMFLETVRAVSVVPAVASVPSKDMYEAILKGIQVSQSLELTVASFQLLHDLDLRHPHVTVRAIEGASDKGVHWELVKNKEEVWSPFDQTFQEFEDMGGEMAAREGKFALKVPMDLFRLLECIADDMHGSQAKVVKKKKVAQKKKVAHDVDTSAQDASVKPVRVLMLRWLVGLLQFDLQSRLRVVQGDLSQLSVVKASLLRRLLAGPYCTTIKPFLDNLLRIIAGTSELLEEEDTEMDLMEQDGHAQGVSTSLGTDFCTSKRDCNYLAQTLLGMVMELDTYKAWSDGRHGTERQDSSGRHFLDKVTNILHYNQLLLYPLLQALESPHLKLRVILSYFMTHTPKAIQEDLKGIGTVQELLVCVAGAKENRNVCKPFTPHELQLLLTYAFQAFLELHYQQKVEVGEVASTSRADLAHVCESLRAAFANLQRLMRDSGELHPAADHALFISEALSNNLSS